MFLVSEGRSRLVAWNSLSDKQKGAVLWEFEKRLDLLLLNSIEVKKAQHKAIKQEILVEKTSKTSPHFSTEMMKLHLELARAELKVAEFVKDEYIKLTARNTCSEVDRVAKTDCWRENNGGGSSAVE